MPKRLLNDEEIAKIAKSAQLNVRLAEPEFTEEIAINKTIEDLAYTARVALKALHNGFRSMNCDYCAADCESKPGDWGIDHDECVTTQLAWAEKEIEKREG